MRALAGQLKFRGQVFWPDDVRHRGLVLITLFVVLKRCAACEDWLPLLDRRDPTGAEAAAIAHPVDLIHHRQGDVAGTQEITVQRMHVALVFDRLAGCRQGLAQHLPAEQLAKAKVLTAPTKEVLLNGFQG